MFGSSSPLEDVNTISNLPDECSTLDDYSTVTTYSRSVNTQTSDRCGASYDSFAVTSACSIITSTISTNRHSASIDCLAVSILQKCKDDFAG